MNFLKLILKKSFFSLLNRKFFITLVISILVSAIIIGIIGYAVRFSVSHFVITLIPPSYETLTRMAQWVVDGGALVVAYLLFSMFIPFIASLFEDQVAHDIENISYPNSPALHPTPLPKAILHGILFSGSLLLINILLLPLHLTPFLSFFSYCPLNAYLLARERFEAVALRYVTPDDSKKIFKANRLKLFSLGLVIIVLSQIPFIKLLVPFISITFMVHSFQEIVKNHSVRTH